MNKIMKVTLPTFDVRRKQRQITRRHRVAGAKLRTRPSPPRPRRRPRCLHPPSSQLALTSSPYPAVGLSFVDVLAMAPNADKMKQKSLMSFFGKKDGADSKAPSATNKPKPKPAVTATPAKSTKTKLRDKENPPSSPPAPTEVHTPMPKGNSQSSGIISATYTRSSVGGSSGRDTPPTSDPIDIDMLSEVEADPSEALQSSAVKSVRDVMQTAHIVGRGRSLRA